MRVYWKNASPRLWPEFRRFRDQLGGSLCTHNTKLLILLRKISNSLIITLSTRLNPMPLEHKPKRASKERVENTTICWQCQFPNRQKSVYRYLYREYLTIP